MAVGDISNKVDTARTKKNSKIQYYTFVEMFDFINLALTENTISQYKSVFDGFEIKKGDKKSFVPHAPYTVSKELFKFIEKRSKDSDTISIHNQETPHENQLFLDGTGDFPKFFESIGMSFDYFTPTNTRSINYALENMSKKPKTLFVHNTTCNTDDIEHAIKWNGDKVYWATCPNANLYIENSLPNYKIFLENKAKMTIGTDSLTSNWQLSIAEEIKTIMKYCSYVSFDDLIVWACKNGAEALGFEDRLGTIAKGKQPGLVHWLLENNNIQNSAITRII
jgi:cytosine/adenosine deaminase-related metal-dependent hydrolase